MINYSQRENGKRYTKIHSQTTLAFIFQEKQYSTFIFGVSQ